MTSFYTYISQFICDHDWIYTRPGKERICARCHRAEVAEHSHLGTRIAWRKLNYWLLVQVSRAYQAAAGEQPTPTQPRGRARRQRRAEIS